MLEDDAEPAADRGGLAAQIVPEHRAFPIGAEPASRAA